MLVAFIHSQSVECFKFEADVLKGVFTFHTFFL